MQLRPYQQESVNAVYDHLRTRDDNPCVVLPTGTGKSLVIGQIVSDAVTIWNGRVLVLAHVKELLEQNANKIQRLCPEIEIGIYSAGLKRRDTEEAVIVAGIQSICQRAEELGPFDLAIVDEAHLIPPEGEGRYRTFLADAIAINPNLRVIGMTATPYRLKGGNVCKPENILNHVCYEAGIKEMILNGYLSPLRSRAGATKADLTNLHVRGGEFIASEIDAAMDQADLVRAACREIIELTYNRQSVLIFTTSVEHCEHVADEISRLSGNECGVVTGETPSGDRDEVLARFRGEKIQTDLFADVKPRLKYLANVNVLTTGFDATCIDCVVLLRPTASVGLYVQMVGRGARLHPGKKDCLILDYGGNVLRHGPIDAVSIVEHDRESWNQSPPAKECPNCLGLIHAAYASCPYCEYQFPPPEKDSHDEHATTEGVLSGEITDTEYNVDSVRFAVHHKKGGDDFAPKTLRIEYQVGWEEWVREWVCPEHSGWPRSKFREWWTARSSYPPPETAGEAVALAEDGALAETKKIMVRSEAGQRFDRVIDYELGGKPDYAPEPGWNDDDDWESDLDQHGLLPSDNWDEIPF